MKYLQLAGGKFTANVREPHELSEKARRAIDDPFEAVGMRPEYLAALTDIQAVRKSGAELTEMEAATLMQKHGVDLVALKRARAEQSDARLLHTIKAWTVLDEENQPVPLTAEGILSLPTPLYEELVKEIEGVDEPLDLTVTPEPGFPTPTSPDSPPA